VLPPAGLCDGDWPYLGRPAEVVACYLCPTPSGMLTPDTFGERLPGSSYRSAYSQTKKAEFGHTLVYLGVVEWMVLMQMDMLTPRKFFIRRSPLARRDRRLHLHEWAAYKVSKHFAKRAMARHTCMLREMARRKSRI